RADFRSILRGLGEVTPDPAVTLLRRRAVASGRLEESFEVTNAGTQRVRFRLTVTAATDLALMERVKSGHVLEPVQAQVESDGHGLAWSRDGFSVRLTSEPAPDALEAAEAAEGRFAYDIELTPGTSWTATLRCTAAYADGDQFPAPPADAVPWRTPALRSADRRFDQWL
ncbi:glycogen debranching N-terminal domain-containing protein, partial [Streptomyces sp. 2MCAF27]